MKEMKIKLAAASDVQELVKIVSDFDGDVDLRSGSYIVDAKSILGVFAIKRSKSIDVIVDNEEEADKLFSRLEKFKA